MVDVVYKRVEPVTVYSATGILAEGEAPGDVIARILPPLEAALEAAGVDYDEPGVFWYEGNGQEPGLRVSVSWLAGDEPVPGDGYDVTHLPAMERVATYRYQGDMAGISAAWDDLMTAITAAGEKVLDGCREVYLQTEPHPQSEWITELQQQVHTD